MLEIFLNFCNLSSCWKTFVLKQSNFTPRAPGRGKLPLMSSWCPRRARGWAGGNGQRPPRSPLARFAGFPHHVRASPLALLAAASYPGVHSRRRAVGDVDAVVDRSCQRIPVSITAPCTALDLFEKSSQPLYRTLVWCPKAEELAGFAPGLVAPRRAAWHRRRSPG